MKYVPTDRCFDNALEFLAEVVRSAGDERELLAWRLVHGVIVPKDGERYSHAWVENVAEQTVYNPVLDHAREVVYMRHPQHIFYTAGRVEWSKAYTIEEAWAENRRSGHYGPWVRSLRALCSDVQRGEAPL